MSTLLQGAHNVNLDSIKSNQEKTMTRVRNYTDKTQIRNSAI